MAEELLNSSLFTLRSSLSILPSIRFPIFATEVVKTDKPIEEIVAGYKEFYKDAKFTHYVDKAIDLKQVVNTNKCLVHVDKYGDKLLITSCIDNLLKGAVGQAVQNMNIMFGLDQTAGLKLKPSAF
jgi:N-acetyl-gamma-glutamyl-phosphate reductase